MAKKEKREVEVKGVKRPPRAQRFLERGGKGKLRKEREGEAKKGKGRKGKGSETTAPRRAEGKGF